MEEIKNESTCEQNEEAQDHFGSLNGSSGFLFDSLCDSALLAALSPQQIPPQFNGEEPAEGAGDNECSPLPSAQERHRSKLLADQMAEKLEAIQWGESSFNLSEWGDSLFVGEHFMERQSLYRRPERSQKDTEAIGPLPQQHNRDQLSSSPGPPAETWPQPGLSVPQNKCSSTIAKTHNEFMRQGRTNAEVENGKQEEKDKDAIAKKLLSNTDPESHVFCSPGMQDIFDQWPNMSDHSWPNTTAGHTNTHKQTAVNSVDAPDAPLTSRQVGKERRELNLPPTAAAETDSNSPQASRQDTEKLAERPGSAGDLVPPTQETPPVTPRVKLTTTSVQSPVTTQPLNQSTPSTLPQQKLTVPTCYTTQPRHSNHIQTATFGQTRTAAHTQKNAPSAPKLRTTPRRGPTTKLDQKCNKVQLSVSPSDTDSSVIDEGFSLQLSQDTSPGESSVNSGAFTIVDVASNKRLFDTFITEWKTKNRFSLSIACERGEDRHAFGGDIGGEHKRGNVRSIKKKLSHDKLIDHQSDLF